MPKLKDIWYKLFPPKKDRIGALEAEVESLKKRIFREKGPFGSGLEALVRGVEYSFWSGNVPQPASFEEELDQIDDKLDMLAEKMGFHFDHKPARESEVVLVKNEKVTVIKKTGKFNLSKKKK